MTRALSDANNGRPKAPDGDTVSALDRLFRAEAPGLLRYFRRRVRSEEDVRDLVQEAFMRFAKASGVAPPLRPAAYLQQIAVRLLIDRSRRPDPPRATLPENLAIRAEQEDALIAEDIMEIYQETLASLPERTRTVFLLHRVESLTYREIGERLGISIPAVQKHIAKALERLALALQGGE